MKKTHIAVQLTGIVCLTACILYALHLGINSYIFGIGTALIGSIVGVNVKSLIERIKSTGHSQ